MSNISHIQTLVGPDFQLFPFGSAALGTATTNSDIDICVGCLNGKTINDFRAVLELDSRVEIEAQIDTTFIPLLKIKWEGDTPIDFTFAQLTRPVNNHLELMGAIEPTEANARAVNSVLVSDWLMTNIKPYGLFCETVKFVKLWAAKNNIYGSMLGFPGGMAWTLMVAKLFQECNFNVVEDVSDVFVHFIEYYREWNWPLPVVLCERDDSDKKYRNWNPYKYPKDRCFMPVITPVYPTMNSTYCVTLNGLRCIQAAMRSWVMTALNAENSITIEIEKPADDDGTFKLKLKGLCTQIFERDGVIVAKPIERSDGSYAIEIYYDGSSDIDLTDVFDGYQFKYNY